MAKYVILIQILETELRDVWIFTVWAQSTIKPLLNVGLFEGVLLLTAQAIISAAVITASF